MRKVKAWNEQVCIPTYEVGEPEKYPLFLEKRVYQGSSGVVYPNPVIEKISDEPIDKKWNAVYLENQYIKLMILPELGGRIQMAYDKIKERHFVYYNHVIKPALVGLTGPWISGGIEFNWPQHHRPSTYSPVDSNIEHNKDGSVTVWVNEVERMFRTKGMAGFTLYPDKAYLEIKGQLYNGTSHPQTFLWWANPAVGVNDEYQSVFPPDVNAVFDHGKRDVSEFPIAKGVYYKVDYSPGTDISKYTNIPVPTSYMAIASKYDFVGGYENDSQSGLLHIANHHVSPGKKQWTWGNGDFGHAWDRNLTQNDGPYIELMCGVYTDNQPDFSWLQPFEEKSFKQYFLPYQHVGLVKNATKEALVNLEFKDGFARIIIYVTADYPCSTIELLHGEEVVFKDMVDLSPFKGYNHNVALRDLDLDELKIRLFDNTGKELVSYAPESENQSEIPEAAKAAKRPEEIKHTEQLYLRGLHLEQYRHATFNPTDYYLEGLKRNPGDVRNNNAMGLWYLRRGRFDLSVPYFKTAIETITEHNPNPYDGEPLFNLGIALNYLEREQEAYDAFYKSCWNAAWQDAGYFKIAQLDCRKGNFEQALEHLEKSLIRNGHNHKARHLKVALLRILNADHQCKSYITSSLEIDQFNFGVLYEKYLVSKSTNDLDYFKESIRDYVHNYIELAIDYAQMGAYMVAIELLEIYIVDKQTYYPIIAYLLSEYHGKLANIEEQLDYLRLAKSMPMDYCFPNRLEELVCLQEALKIDFKDDKAFYYLGNFWYANRQYEKAQSAWESSLKANMDNPICHRNLALLYYNKLEDKEKAKKHLETSFEKDPESARVLMELDQLYKKINKDPKQRLDLLEDHLDLCLERDDLYLERISLYNYFGRHNEALNLIEQRNFHPWEGGEGKVPFQYVTANIEVAKQKLLNNKSKEAISYLNAAKSYPLNLGEGKLIGAQENDINFWLGFAHHQLKEFSESQEYFNLASKGLTDPSLSIYYNDQQPDKIFYKGLALLKSAEEKQANACFQSLIDYGNSHKNDEIKIDYFAISLPDFLIFDADLNLRNKLHCHYLIGLGLLGLGKFTEAKSEFEFVLLHDNSNIGAKIHLLLCDNNLLKADLSLKNIH